jgi:hypothetical protein
LKDFQTPSTAQREDYHFYNIIMPYTSFDTISITCIDPDYNNGIVLVVKQVIDDVEHV